MFWNEFKRVVGKMGDQSVLFLFYKWFYVSDKIRRERQDLTLCFYDMFRLTKSVHNQSQTVSSWHCFIILYSNGQDGIHMQMIANLYHNKGEHFYSEGHRWAEMGFIALFFTSNKSLPQLYFSIRTCLLGSCFTLAIGQKVLNIKYEMVLF